VNLGYHHITNPKVRLKSTDDFIDFIPNDNQSLSFQTLARVRTKVRLRSLWMEFYIIQRQLMSSKERPRQKKYWINQATNASFS
jgi:hypothetical protein